MEEQPWYHGDISRTDAVPLLKKDGDYLVRFSNQQQQHVLAVMNDGAVKNFLINEEASNKVCTLCKLDCLPKLYNNIMSAVLYNNSHQYRPQIRAISKP